MLVAAGGACRCVGPRVWASGVRRVRGVGGRGMATAAWGAAGGGSPKKHYLLTYDYVPDILARRDPYRAAHLAGITRAVEEGTIVVAGARGAKEGGGAVDGGVLVFCVDEGLGRAHVEAYAKADPYVTAGLVTEWQVRDYLVPPGGSK